MCQHAEETFNHVLHCSSEPVTMTRQALLNRILDSLLSLNTPKQILISIHYGMHHWLSGTESSTVYAPSRGSLENGDIYIY
jgi:hypothetical protein